MASRVSRPKTGSLSSASRVVLHQRKIVRPLFSYLCKALSPQLPYFDIDTKPPGGVPPCLQLPCFHACANRTFYPMRLAEANSTAKSGA